MGKLDSFLPYAVVAAAVGVAYLVFKPKKKTKGERARAPETESARRFSRSSE